MKAIVCEICGSLHFLKKDGVYICEGCGTKYTVEEISALVQEVPDGDSTDAAREEAARQEENKKNAQAAELELLYQNARSARDSGEYRKAAQDYEKIFSKDSSSWEAAFYGSYARAKICTVYQLRPTGHAVRNGVSTALKLIHTQISDRRRQIEAVQEIAAHATEISDYLYDMARNHYDSLAEPDKSNNKQTVINDCAAAIDILYGLGNDIDTLFPEHAELNAAAAEAWKGGIAKDIGLLQWVDYKEAAKNSIMEYVPKIQKYDKGYIPPEIQEKKRGCYIATAVYGSYDCPEVWTLRRYRDRILAATGAGRLFIRFYYAISPALVRQFGHSVLFRTLWKPWLDRKVKKLNDAGIDNTPYRDT